MAKVRYSRLQTVQQKKEQRKAFLFLVLTALLGVVFIFKIFPLIPRVANYFGLEKKDNEAVQQTEVLTAPRIEDLPQYTNDSRLVLRGNTIPGKSVIVSHNGSEKELITDSDGEFSSSITLQKGENTIFAYLSEAESDKSTVQTVIFDEEAPKLEIIKPNNEESFYGSLAREQTIEGQTEEDASVTINDRIVVVGRDGKFSFKTQLSEGTNEFNIMAKDEAGNETEINLKVNYSL